MMLRRSQVRIPLAGALASLVFLAALALITRAVVRKITFDDLDEELETLSVAIGSDLELQGIAAVEHASFRKGVETNVLMFRLERHSAILVDRQRVVAAAGDLAANVRANEALRIARHAEGAFIAVEPFSGQQWRCRFRVLHLSGAAAGATLIVFRSIEPALRGLDRLDLALLLLVIAGVAGSGAILAVSVRRALRPVEEVTRIAERAEASDLSQRVSVRGAGEEVDRLSAVIDSLFERLERAFQSQRRFVADAAHELKTPAAAILAEAQEALREDTSEEGRRKLIESMAGAAKALARETDDLLTLARGESPVRETAPVDLREIADSVARGKRVELQIEGDVVIEGDKAALQRMLANLVSNALRYSDAPVEVAIKTTGDGVDLAVADRGPGIPADDRTRIFERFVRLPDGRRRSPDGSGLGLAIVMQAVRNHGGSIEVIGREGGGSVFAVHLPRRVTSRRS